MLLNSLTILYVYQRITQKELLEFFRIYRLNITNQSSLNPSIFMKEQRHLRVFPNDLIFNDYGKYQIMEYMERLIENEFINPESSFGLSPKETIKNTLKQYEKVRKKTLDTIEAISQKNLE